MRLVWLCAFIPLIGSACKPRQLPTSQVKNDFVVQEPNEDGNITPDGRIVMKVTPARCVLVMKLEKEAKGYRLSLETNQSVSGDGQGCEVNLDQSLVLRFNRGSPVRGGFIAFEQLAPPSTTLDIALQGQDFVGEATLRFVPAWDQNDPNLKDASCVKDAPSADGEFTTASLNCSAPAKESATSDPQKSTAPQGFELSGGFYLGDWGFMPKSWTIWTWVKCSCTCSDGVTQYTRTESRPFYNSLRDNVVGECLNLAMSNLMELVKNGTSNIKKSYDPSKCFKTQNVLWYSYTTTDHAGISCTYYGGEGQTYTFQHQRNSFYYRDRPYHEWISEN